MSKLKILDKKSERSIKYEKQLLQNLRHPFIINMHYAFQDHENLYLVMDLLTGGDLRYQIGRNKTFTEEQTRFFITCIVLGLEYLHNNEVIHRDIKPENLVLDENGYVRITDFGVAKLFEKQNSQETSGTPGYMAPEVMCGQNHTMAVDYFALGVIAYEFMNGKRPYLGKTRKEIKDQILAKQVQIKPDEKPDDWSNEAVDFINRRKATNRLGFKGPQEVKEHPWLKYYPWHMLYEKTLQAPYVPRFGDNFDKRYCEIPEKIGSDTLHRYESYFKDENFSIIFGDFTCFNTDSIEKFTTNTVNTKENPKDKVNLIKKKSNFIINRPDGNPTLNKLQNLKLNLNSTTKTKLFNTAITTKIAFNSLDRTKKLSNTNSIGDKQLVAPISFNKEINYLHTPEIKKAPSRFNLNSGNNESLPQKNLITKFRTNISEKNKLQSDLLLKKINQVSFNSNNSSNSNMSNIPTNYMINSREKRTNSMAGITSPIGGGGINLSNSKNKNFASSLQRSNSNFNTNFLSVNNLAMKKNSLEIKLNDYDTGNYKLTKIISKNSDSISGSSNLQLNKNHFKKNSYNSVMKLK